jgi:hypothetical protein
MKNLIIFGLCAVILTAAGCANIKVTKITPEGVKWTAEYTRWFNQKIDGFALAVEPNGVIHISFEGQLSDTQIAFKLGQMSVGAGGAK